jgi:hypothetical protein
MAFVPGVEVFDPGPAGSGPGWETIYEGSLGDFPNYLILEPGKSYHMAFIFPGVASLPIFGSVLSQAMDTATNGVANALRQVGVPDEKFYVISGQSGDDFRIDVFIDNVDPIPIPAAAIVAAVVLLIDLFAEKVLGMKGIFAYLGSISTAIATRQRYRSRSSTHSKRAAPSRKRLKPSENRRNICRSLSSFSP